MPLPLARAWVRSLAALWSRRQRPIRSHVRPRFRPCLERLEDRLTLNAYMVNLATDASGSNAGSGAGLTGDLRYCIDHAVVDRQVDTITFDPTVFNAAKTITLASSLDTDPGGARVFSQTAFVVITSAWKIHTKPSEGVAG
jgi:hypothetical protein